MNHMTLSLLLTLAMSPAFGQTIYKCPRPDGYVNIQQMPCSPTGGGETMAVKPIPTGAGSGLSDDAKAYMGERDKHWAEKAKADNEEAQRQEGLNIERAKVKAEQDQAAAQRATTRAIWNTGIRRR
ncbi:MAG: hypothetical protein WAV07_19685 [Candidatus Contendobacter sp.]